MRSLSRAAVVCLILAPSSAAAQQHALARCFQHVLPFRVRTLTPPEGNAGKPRQILEVYGWISGRHTGELRRDLSWMVLEVVERTLEVSAFEVVLIEPGSAWPVRPVPADVKSDFKFTGEGEVDYTITRPTPDEAKSGRLRTRAEMLTAVRQRLRELSRRGISIR